MILCYGYRIVSTGFEYITIVLQFVGPLLKFCYNLMGYLFASERCDYKHSLDFNTFFVKCFKSTTAYGFIFIISYDYMLYMVGFVMLCIKIVIFIVFMTVSS